MKILLTGATGFIGSKIGHRLIQENHDLVILTRSESAAREKLPFPFVSYTWDSLKDVPPPKALEGVDAVIHLAGESVAARRWTQEEKEKILQSRVMGTRHLMQAIAWMPKKPKVFISASAIGYYGDAGNSVLNESSPTGKDFLAQVCESWEKEVFTPSLHEMRRVAIRIGMVLGNSGGSLQKLVPLFKLGLGGPLGHGRQWMSWIHVDDLVSLFYFCLNHPSISGPVNGVSPEPVSNRSFSQSLGHTLGRPSFLPTPAIVLKLALGEMSTVILASQRVVPEKAVAEGFRFQFSQLEEALKSLF